MKDDFNWVRRVITNSENKPIHIDALITISDLFKKKWAHYENDRKYRDTYLLYISYLRVTLNSLKN